MRTYVADLITENVAEAIIAHAPKAIVGNYTLYKFRRRNARASSSGKRAPSRPPAAGWGQRGRDARLSHGRKKSRPVDK